MRPARRRIDLQRLREPWRTLLALSVVVAVGLAAWLVGRDRPIPPWITNGLVPALGVTYIVLVAIAIIARLRRKKDGAQRNRKSGRDRAG